LVKLGQTWSKFSELWETYSGPQSGQKRSGQTLVKLQSTLVKLGQPWENLVGFWEMRPKPHFEVI
jgi:hypothetical protein